MPKPSLCLNMIVKNEAARIERCLVSVLPYVKCAAILDTGSTDDTKDIIRDVCSRLGVPVEIRDGAFIDFSHARNTAFKVAQDARDVLPWFNFVLLMDADMELVVADEQAFNLDANALAYDMMQKGGAVSYANRRVININWGKPPYVGVTHEYVDVPAAGMITGAMFVDHADGSNRVEKFPRDAALLEQALLKEPNNGRYLYYLGNTYRDWGRPIEAIGAYDKRIALGGWDEETHSAMMSRAHCWKDRGDNDKFVAGLLEAYNFRPQRAEPLYDLANYYRLADKPNASALIANAGRQLKRPNDLLFVNDFVYEHGLDYELSICGFYGDVGMKHTALVLTDKLALDPSCPAEFRNNARSNLFWHTKPLKEYCPSFTPSKIDFTPPDGYTPLNPSVEISHGLITCNIRTVNYRINEQGQYTINGVPIYWDGPAIDTRNVLVDLDWNDLSVRHQSEIMWDRPAPLFGAVTGLEDIRLWRFDNLLHFSATVREQSKDGVCQIGMGRLQRDIADPNFVQVLDFKIISDEATNEKNWMPVPAHWDTPSFMYRLDKVIRTEPNPGIRRVHEGLHLGEISGSSQLVPYGYGYLAVTHEASSDPSTGKRTYWHRFAYFDDTLRLRTLSRPFVFFERQIEFCSGLAVYRDGKLLLSFGVRDEEAWIATIQDYDIGNMLSEGIKA